MPWAIELRGGHYHGIGLYASGVAAPASRIVVWSDGEREYAGEDPTHPAIRLETAQAYRCVERDDEARRLVYEVGDLEPPREDPLAMARGVCLAVPLGLVLWAVAAVPVVLGVPGGVW